MSARPKLRWWWPHCLVDPDEIRNEIDQMYAAGFGGAEINDVLSSTNELASSYSRPGSDDRGSDEESEFEVVEDDEEITEWSKPGPSPLRDGSPFRPRKLHLLNRAPKPVRIIPIVRNSRHKYGVDCEDKRKKALYRCHFRR